jgi:F0F1-type ATP synthase epsilon subunit
MPRLVKDIVSSFSCKCWLFVVACEHFCKIYDLSREKRREEKRREEKRREEKRREEKRREEKLRRFIAYLTRLQQL